jgi:hypothetical protein
MSRESTAAGLYGSSFELQDAVDRLDRCRVALAHLSFAGRACPPIGALGRIAGRRIECDSPRAGAFWVTGPLADSIIASQRWASGGSRSNEFTAGLERMGVSERRAREYEEALAAGGSVLFAHGTLEELSRAIEILSEGAKVVRLHVAGGARIDSTPRTPSRFPELRSRRCARPPRGDSTLPTRP